MALKFMPKKIVTKAFAVATYGAIDLCRIEPFTDSGREQLTRTLNRPAGERVITIVIREQR